jgi:outer membrane protein OmpA-like peptidoglycan-associated protein/tetratricopeptide (TPR) repeat protein
MKKLVFIAIWILLLGETAKAQEQPGIKQQADKLFERYQYFKSLNLYLKLDRGSNTNAVLLERIGLCYYNIGRYAEAEPFFARAMVNPKVSPVSHYYYAETLLRNQKFEAAKQQYQYYFAGDTITMKQKLAMCDSAEAWMKAKPQYLIANEKDLNTQFSDWGLAYDGKTGLIFTSDRRVYENDTDDRTGNNWFKLYEWDINGNRVNDLRLTSADENIFINSYHAGPLVMNKTADTAYITVTTALSPKEIKLDERAPKSTQKLYTRRLQLVIAVKKNGAWTVVSSFPYNDIQKYSLGEAALSRDGKVIYFTSDMPGGIGQTDLWYCEKLPNGSWAKPVNCGKTVNTAGDEAFPTIGGDGALYYSSKGLAGMGGFDIYKAKGEKAAWGTPENLKYPLNSTNDDFYLTTRDGLTGYLSSNRAGGQGSDDIYSFIYKPDTIPQRQITRVDTAKKQTAKPAPITVGIVLKTIYYDLDKSAIRPDAAAELNQLAILLEQHPALKIELSSYTDSRASETYNLALSQRRANAAVAYLVNNGIGESRLVARFYGKSNLVNNCGDNAKCTEELHQLNRRTEFKVIGGE